MLGPLFGFGDPRVPECGHGDILHLLHTRRFFERSLGVLVGLGFLCLTSVHSLLGELARLLLLATVQIESKIPGFSFSFRWSTFGVVLLNRLSLVGAGAACSDFGLFLLPSGLPLFGATGVGGGSTGCANSGSIWS